MSSGDRHRVIAFVAAVALGLAICAIVVSFIWGLAALITKERIEAERYTAHYAERASQQAEESCNSTDRAALRKCIEEVIESSRESERSEADLNAQRQMANWAYAMVVISFFSFLLTIAGIYFVIQNLNELRKTNSIAQKLGEAETRAYLTCIAGRFDITGLEAVLSMKIKNTGQSPGKRVTVRGDITVHIIEIEGEYAGYTTLKSREAFNTGQDVSAQETVISDIVWRGGDIPITMLDELVNPTRDITFEIQIVWFDVFDNIRTAEVTFDTMGNGSPRGLISEIKRSGDLVAHTRTDRPYKPRKKE